MMKKVLRILAILTLMAVLISGCSFFGTQEFVCQELTMTVPGYMSDVSDESEFSGFAFALDSRSIAILGIREEISLFEGTVVEDLASYTDAVIQGNQLNSDAKSREGKDYRYFTYTADSNGATYGYVCGTFQSEDAFWLVQVASEEDKFDEAEFLEILDTVVFP